MNRTFVDYFNKTAITLPDKYINVKTGETNQVRRKVQEEIEYHAENNTLVHLILSAVDHYLSTKDPKDSNETDRVLAELNAIKEMLVHVQLSEKPKIERGHLPQKEAMLNIKEVNDLLEAFGN